MPPIHETFQRGVIARIPLIDAVDEEFDHKLAPLIGEGNLRDAEEKGIPVLARIGKGNLGIGWIEGQFLIIYTGAFQDPEGKYCFDRAPKYSHNQTFPLSTVENHTDDLSSQVIKGLELLKDIAP